MMPQNPPPSVYMNADTEIIAYIIDAIKLRSSKGMGNSEEYQFIELFGGVEVQLPSLR